MKTIDEIREEIRLTHESMNETVRRQREAERSGRRDIAKRMKCQVGYVQRQLRQLAHEAERAFG